MTEPLLPHRELTETEDGYSDTPRAKGSLSSRDSLWLLAFHVIFPLTRQETDYEFHRLFTHPDENKQLCRRGPASRQKVRPRQRGVPPRAHETPSFGDR